MGFQGGSAFSPDNITLETGIDGKAKINNGLSPNLQAWTFDSVISGTWSLSATVGQLTGGSMMGTVNGGIIRYKHFLEPGTYTVSLFGITSNARGKIKVSVDGVDIGTIDEYDASVILNKVFTVTTSLNFKKRDTVDVDFTLDGKNASSAGFTVNMSALHFERTGDST